MKKEAQKEARKLRAQGHSIKEITRHLGVAKSSVSIWVRDIELTSQQKNRLSKKGHSLEAIEKRRSTRLANERARRQIFIDAAKRDIKKISKRDLFMIGISLYWGEGSKTKRNSVEFANSDPRLIQIMMLFFSKVCEVPQYKFRGHVYLHPHLNVTKAEKYWSSVSGIPLKQFQKTTQQHNKGSRNKKDTLPYGTFMIGVYDTKLFLKIMGWMNGIHTTIVK